MNARAQPQATGSTLASRFGTAAHQAVRKHHALTGSLPSSAQASFTVRIDGQTAIYTATLKRVGGAAR